MFKSGYTLMLFGTFEDDVVDFLTYVPLEYYLGDKRKEIYSPKLAELLIRIGSQVDNFFRNWDVVHDAFKAKYPTKELNLDELNMRNFKDIEIYLGPLQKLSMYEIRILSTGEIIKPFKSWTDRGYPLWWDAYNNVKHQGFINREQGNLSNVIQSLSALFILNCVNIYTNDKLREYGYEKFPGTLSGTLYKSQLFGFYPHKYS